MTRDQKLFFNQIKEEFGGRIRFILTGGAPLSKECSQFLRTCFGVPVIQGYALTETTGGSTVQELDDREYGEVGPPVCNAQIKLVDCPDFNYFSTDKPYPRGEIWVKGPTVSTGYFNLPEKTAEDFKDGWFATGDIGEFLPNGVLKIIDRKKKSHKTTSW